MNKSLIAAVPLLWATAVSPALAQQASVFTLTAQQGQTITPIANLQSLAITSTGIGQANSFTLSGTYTGATSATIGTEAQIVGSTDFTVGHISPAVPTVLNPGQSFKVTVTYTPSSTAVATAQLLISFAQNPATSGGTPTPGQLAFTLNGATANLTVNYISAPSNNVTSLSSGGTITYPSTLVNNSAAVTVVIANAGSAASRVTSVALTGGSAFQLQSLGFLPATVQAGGSFSFNVIYTPTASGNDTGTLTIQLPGGPFVVNLAGTGTSSSLTYEMIDGNTSTPLTAGKTIALPDTDVGNTSTVTIQVQNTGSAPATINNISNSGVAFTLGSLPVVPLTIPANSSISFTLTFAPSAPVSYSGTLTIGNTRFSLAGTGIGALLNFTYTTGSTTSAILLAGQIIVLPSVPLAQSSSTTVTVNNAGTLPTTITSIGVASTGTTSSAYTLSNLPSLPVTLNPKDKLTFTLTFAPVIPGLNSAVLLVNTSALNLSGFGTTAPPLPSYQITGASGTIQPFTQPTVGLTLSQGYPLNLTGVLTLGVSSNFFVGDPAVQFATGGRTIAFTIPANTTQAVFANGSNSIQFQSGTIAENIDFSATFATASGVNVTPAGASSSNLVLTVPSAAPTLLTVSISALSSSSLSVLVEGYSTTRSLGKLTFQFASLSPSFSFATTSFTLDVSQSSTFWYANSASQPFGGEFAITYPFTLSIPTGTTLPLANNIKVTVTATNSTGTSNTLSSQ